MFPFSENISRVCACAEVGCCQGVARVFWIVASWKPKSQPLYDILVSCFGCHLQCKHVKNNITPFHNKPHNEAAVAEMCETVMC